MAGPWDLCRNGSGYACVETTDDQMLLVQKAMQEHFAIDAEVGIGNHFSRKSDQLRNSSGNPVLLCGGRAAALLAGQGLTSFGKMRLFIELLLYSPPEKGNFFVLPGHNRHGRKVKAVWQSLPGASLITVASSIGEITISPPNFKSPANFSILAIRNPP